MARQATAHANRALRQALQLPDAAMIALHSMREMSMTVTAISDGMDINTRYAREVLGLLLHNRLAELVEDDDGDRYRITHAGREYLTGGQGRGSIVPTATKPEGRPAMVKNGSKIEFKKCGCGCGEDIGGKSTFKQGHDARMVSQLVAAVVGHGKANAVIPPAFTATDTKNAIAGNMDIQESINRTTDAVERLFGEKLASKFHSAAMNGWQNYDKPAKAPRARKPKTVTVKVGRWEKTGTIDANGNFTDAKTGKVTPAGKYKAA